MRRRCRWGKLRKPLPFAVAMLRFLTIALAFFLTAAPAWGQNASGCPPFHEPAVVVTPLLAAPLFNVARNLAEIRVMATQGGIVKYSSAQHEAPVGLTAASLTMGSHYEIHTTSQPGDPMICAQVSTFDLRFGFPDTTVFLARELPPGSCGYNVILEHEMKHVGVDRGFVQDYAPLLPDLLRKAIREIGMIRAGSPQAAEAQIQAALQHYTEGLGQSLAAVRQQRQTDVDSPEEYDRLSHSCNGDLAALIRQTVEGR